MSSISGWLRFEMSESLCQLSTHIIMKIKNLSSQDKKKIYTIIEKAKSGGASELSNLFVSDSKLPIRNKCSDNVNTDDFNFLEKVRLVQQHGLWHVHAGFYNDRFNSYPISNGFKVSTSGQDLVSQWLVHYKKRDDNKVDFVDLKAHPPLNVLDININSD